MDTVRYDLQRSDALARETVALKESPNSSHFSRSSPQRKSLCESRLTKSPEILTQTAGSENCSSRTETVQRALPYLEQAAQLNSGNYENAHELALAYARTGQYERARTKVEPCWPRRTKLG